MLCMLAACQPALDVCLVCRGTQAVMIVQKQAKQMVAQHKTQPPHQNRLGLSVGATGRAPQDDTQVTAYSLPCVTSLPLRVQASLCVTGSLCMLTAGKAQSYIATAGINNSNQSFDTLAIAQCQLLVYLFSGSRHRICHAARTDL